ALSVSLDTVRSAACRGLAALREPAQAQPQPPVQTPGPQLVERSDLAMTIDLERDLRRELDAATLPSTLTFHPESVVREGRLTIRRRRTLVAVGGSAALV